MHLPPHPRFNRGNKAYATGVETPCNPRGHRSLPDGVRGAGPDAVRGRPVLHRGAGLARRRCREGREPRRAAIPAAHLAATPAWTDPISCMFNANKKSITVNLKTAAGLELVKDLAAQGRRVHRELRARRDRAAGPRLRCRSASSTRRIIYCQVKGFGEGSPYEKNLAFDMIAQACGGTMSITGEPDGPPAEARPARSATPAPACCWRSPSSARCIGRKEHRPGRAPAGRDAGRDAALHPHRVRRPARTGQRPRRARRPAACRAAIRRCGIFPCKGGGPNDYVYVYTSRANPEHWRRLLDVIGREDLIGDPRYDTPPRAPSARTR